VAVLGAAAGLEGHDALDLDLGAAPAHPHVVGEREQVRDPVVGEFEDLEHLGLGQADTALQDLFACHVHDVGAAVDLLGCCGHDFSFGRRALEQSVPHRADRDGATNVTRHT
jgi:hypothetical protein